MISDQGHKSHVSEDRTLRRTKIFHTRRIVNTDRIRAFFPKTTTTPLLNSSRGTANVPHAGGLTTNVVSFVVIRCLLGDITSSHESEDMNGYFDLHERIDHTPLVDFLFRRNFS